VVLHWMNSQTDSDRERLREVQPQLDPVRKKAMDDFETKLKAFLPTINFKLPPKATVKSQVSPGTAATSNLQM
jgi:hypothetical protein